MPNSSLFSRILGNLGQVALDCRIECWKYFPSYVQHGHTVLCKITWPCGD